MKRIMIIAIAVLFGCACLGSASAKTFVTIGTGGVTGVYYPTGGAISRMVNQKADVYGIKCTVESTGGSVYNVNAVLSGDLDFGVSQSDRQYQAMMGQAEWETAGPQKDLRSVFSLHPESMTCVAAASIGAKNFSDLKGKRVNIGNPGSGQLQNSKDVLEAMGMTLDDIKAEYAKAVESPSLLQDEKIDAFVYTVGHPNGNIKEATSGRIKVSIVPIKGPGVEKLIEKYPYYAESIIPVKDYPQAVNEGDVTSIGVLATLVTSAKVSDDIVYAVAKEVFENLESFKKLHPAFAILTKESMLKGLSAPIHPGALKYYKEAGLDKLINPKLIP